MEWKRLVRTKETEMEEWRKDSDRRADQMMLLVREMGREMLQMKQQLGGTEDRLGMWERWRTTTN